MDDAASVGTGPVKLMRAWPRLLASWASMMPVHWMLLLTPCLVIVGIYGSRIGGDPIRKLARALLGTLFLIEVVLAVSGSLHGDATFGEIHKWWGHALVVIAWLVAPFSLGVVAQLHFGKRPIRSATVCLALIILLFSITSCSLTGYLGPSYIPPDSPFSGETYYRFLVLHVFATPLVIAVSTAFAWWFLRSRGHRVEERVAPNEEKDPKNPYCPPLT